MNGFYQLQIQTNNGLALLAVNNCVTNTVYLLLHSLFKEVTVKFNYKTVSDPSNMYVYRAYMETFFNYSSDVHSYHFKAKGWHKNTHDTIDKSEPKHNKGLLEREKYCAEVQKLRLSAVRIWMCSTLKS